MTQAELLRYVAETLDALGVEYMIGGSHAAMFYGEPRLTRDVDVVAALESGHVEPLIARFPADDFYVDADAVREAIRTCRQFNVIHPASGLTVDVYVNPDTPYDRTRLARRHRLAVGPGVGVWFARPEDVILYKLLYYRQGRSTIHLRDIRGILRVSGDDIDRTYLAEWIGRLGLAAVWNEVEASEA